MWALCMQLAVSFWGFVLRYERLTQDVETRKESLKCGAIQPTSRKGTAGAGREGPEDTDSGDAQGGRKQDIVAPGKKEPSENRKG